MASRNFAQLVCRLSLLSFRRGAIQRNTLQNLSPLSRANAENNVFRKTVHLSSVWRKHFPCIDRSTTGDENSDGSDDSWRSWNGPGILFMVGGVVLSSDDRTTQHSPGTPAGKRGTEGRRRELQDERGRFASTSRVEKSRTGFQRTRGIREWRAKRKLEFDENDPPTKLETRASKVRVHFEIQKI